MTAKQQLRSLRRDLRARRAERKRWLTGEVYADHWGVPWCRGPRSPYCCGPGCDGCAVVAGCRAVAAEIDTSEIERKIAALLDPAPAPMPVAVPEQPALW